jgi:hypothetical protein
VIRFSTPLACVGATALRRAAYARRDSPTALIATEDHSASRSRGRPCPITARSRLGAHRGDPLARGRAGDVLLDARHSTRSDLVALARSAPAAARIRASPQRTSYAGRRHGLAWIGDADVAARRAAWYYARAPIDAFPLCHPLQRARTKIITILRALSDGRRKASGVRRT